MASRSVPKVPLAIISWVPLAIISWMMRRLVVGEAGSGVRRIQHDVDIRLVRRTDRDPAHLVATDVEANLETEGVAVEGKGFFRVFVRRRTSSEC